MVQYDTPEAMLEQPATAFAARFLGSDRALKRLSRLNVADYMGPAPRVVWDGTHLGNPLNGPARYVWATEPRGRLVGSVDLNRVAAGEKVEAVLSPADPEDLGVRLDSSLREALSVMVGSGARSLPVVDKAGHLAGEVSLEAIEAAGRGTKESGGTL